MSDTAKCPDCATGRIRIVSETDPSLGQKYLNIECDNPDCGSQMQMPASQFTTLEAAAEKMRYTPGYDV